MEQMADEMTGANAERKGRGNAAEESPVWVREERIQSEAQVSEWRQTEPVESSRDGEAQRPGQCDSSTSPLFSLKMFLRRSSSSASSTSSTESLSSSQESNTVDCAGIVLKCLFCRFYDLILMLPGSCERVANRCCPSYKHVISTMESASNKEDDTCMDWDCGLFSSCQDASECLELAMEISELCYR
ncbi:myoD family inhibitor domain-containing protein 2 [Genypterus blacodes]|uniref:myoD family inhibitor domain-containing protein 2 n=1 Tax=Genypterus blacodes TaxID=154954 RepID=UPI003F76E294